MNFDAETWRMIGIGMLQTIYMTGIASLLSYVLGLPLGVILVVTEKEWDSSNADVKSYFRIYH